LLVASLSAEAKTRTSRKKPDPRTAGLGRSCKKRADCKSKSQVCLRMSDARGKQLPSGFCALPCASIDLGPARSAPPPKPARGASDGGVASLSDAGVPAQREGPGAVDAAAQAANAHPATPAEIKDAAKRRTAPRCPAKFQCRSAGAGVPIDLCVRE
jgi:hypothetical protein